MTLRWVVPAAAALALVGCGGGDSPAAERQAATPDESAEDRQPANESSPDAPDEQPRTDTGGGNPSEDAAENGAADGADVEAAVDVEGGEVHGGTARIQADVGDTVSLTVTSDVSDTVHVHGYDLEQAVAPEEPATLEFTADIPGVFEIELHDSGLKLADLEVGG